MDGNKQSISFYSKLVQKAKDEGFPYCGAIDYKHFIDAKESEKKSYYRDHYIKYKDWINSGYAGSMSYLVRGLDRRANPLLVFPETKSVFCVLLPYSAKSIGSSDGGVRYARYLRGRDYHLEVSTRLEKALKKIDEPDLKWKICVDTSAVLERTWAALCGLGWIGKNTMLIHPKLGSYFYIGVVFLNKETKQLPGMLPNFCGHCNKCMENCPTKAIIKENVINSNKCVSYLTLEKRNDFDTDKLTKKLIGNWVAGCDICQEVCPFNYKRSKSEEKDICLENDFHLNQNIDYLLNEDFDRYKKRVKNIALNRVKPAQFKRNFSNAFKNILESNLIDHCNFSGIEKKIESLYTTSDCSDEKQNWKNCLDIIKNSNQSRLDKV